MASIVGITLEEAEEMARTIPRARFTYSVQTSGSSGFGGGFYPFTIQELKDAIAGHPLNSGIGSNGIYIYPVFVMGKDNE